MLITSTVGPASQPECVLLIACSDDAAKHEHISTSAIIHRIQLPGGLLFPDLFTRIPFVRALLRRALFFAAVKMVLFKQPTVVYICGHNPCTAAKLLNLAQDEVERRLQDFARKLTAQCGVRTVVTSRVHCPCATWHEPHVVLQLHEPPAAVRAA